VIRWPLKLRFYCSSSAIGSDVFNSENEAERWRGTLTGSCMDVESQTMWEGKRYLIFAVKKPGLAPENGTGRAAPPRT
jgi:hypothetical protein